MQKPTRGHSYLHERNSNSNSKSSTMTTNNHVKGVFDGTPYFSCIARHACQDETSPKAAFYCVQCANLQCIPCEKSLHQDPSKQEHVRVDVDLMSGESCSVDRSHPAILYCSKCALPYCYTCFEQEHQQANKRDHKAEKYPQDQILYPTKQHRFVALPSFILFFLVTPNAQFDS